MAENSILLEDSVSDSSLSIITQLRKHPKSLQIQEYLTDRFDKERYEHIYSVQETAVRLAICHNADVWKTHLAALLHDVAKWMCDDELYQHVSRYNIQLDPIEEKMPALLHAIVGVKYAIDLFEVTDLEVLEAIRCHTTGNASMGLIAKLIYVADFAEPTREYSEAEHVREIAANNLDQAVHDVACYKIGFLLKKGWIIHSNTIHTYNESLVKQCEF